MSRLTQKEINSLKCNKTSRYTALSIMPIKYGKIYNTIQIIRQKYDKTYNNIDPHIHLLWPFLPENTLDNVIQILSQSLKFKKFKIIISNISRYDSHGKQSGYLTFSDDTTNCLIQLQKNILQILNSKLQQSTSNINTNSSLKQKSKKKSKKQKSNINSESKSCLEAEIRNAEYSPHLTVGQMTIDEYKLIKSMIFPENNVNNGSQNSNETKMDSNENVELSFDVESIHVLIAKNGKWKTYKSVPLCD